MQRGVRRRPPTLGIDVGGVLVDRVAEGEDTSFFGNRPMETPPVEGCEEAVRELLELFGHCVFIVSKAGPKIADLTRKWLGQRELVGPQGISPAAVHFVRKRPDKHPVCERLGITQFIDDRLDVLNHLVSVDRRILFTGGLGANPVPIDLPLRSVVTLDSWPRVVDWLHKPAAGVRDRSR